MIREDQERAHVTVCLDAARVLADLQLEILSYVQNVISHYRHPRELARHREFVRQMLSDTVLPALEKMLVVECDENEGEGD